MALFIARFVTQAQTGTTYIPEATDDAFDDIADVHTDTVLTPHAAGVVKGQVGNVASTTVRASDPRR